MSRLFKLIIEDDEGKTTVVPLNRDDVTIGRMEGNTIRLMERNVSRRHARLTRMNGSVFIDDLNSFNGVKINGERIDRRIEIKEGDLVEIGDYHLALQAEEAELGIEASIPSPAQTAAQATTPMRAHAPTASRSAPPNAATVQQSVAADLLDTAAPQKSNDKSTAPDFRPPHEQAAALRVAAGAGPNAATKPDFPLDESEPMVQPPPRAPMHSSLPPFPTTGVSNPGGLAAPTVPDTSLASLQQGDVGAILHTEQMAIGPGIVADYPRLICVSTEYAGREFALNQPEVVIGRVEDNDVVIEHRSVSRNHAKVVYKNGVHKIVDLESANGILVNGEEYAITDLRKGDLIELGHVRFRYVPATERYEPTEEESVAMMEAGVSPPGQEAERARASASNAPTQVESISSAVPASDPSNAETITDTPYSALSASYGAEPRINAHSLPTEPPGPELRPDSLTAKNPVNEVVSAASKGYQYTNTAVTDFEEDIRRDSEGRQKLIGAAAVLLVLVGFLIYVATKFVGDGNGPDQEIQKLYQKGDWAQVEAYFKDHRAEFDDFDKAFNLATEAHRRVEAEKPRGAMPDPEGEPEGDEAVAEPEPEPEPEPPEEADVGEEEEEDEPDSALATDTDPDPAAKRKVKKPPVRASKKKPALTKAKEFEQQGIRKMTFGDLTTAEQLFKKCLQTAEYAPCHRQLGVLYATKDDTARSVRHYRRYIELAPSAGDADRVRQIIKEATGN